MSETATPPTAPTEGAPPPVLNGSAAAGLRSGSDPAPVPPPAGSEARGGSEGQPDPRDWLPEPYRADPTFKDLKDIDGLAKSYKHAASLVGIDKAQVLRIPAADDAEGWAAVHAQLGRPEAPEGYEFPEMPAPLDTVMEQAARGAFHKAGLSAAQGRQVMELYGGLVQQAQQQRAQQAEQLEAAVVADLQKEWGEAFDARVAAANQVINELGGEPLAQAMQSVELADGTRLGQHPALIRFLAEIGARLAEPTALKGGAGGATAPGPYTPEAALAEVSRLRDDKEFHAARRTPTHPDHARNAALWDRLHQAIAAGTPGRLE